MRAQPSEGFSVMHPRADPQEQITQLSALRAGDIEGLHAGSLARCSAV